eukprot:3900701-Heterocapsa_arctica.AAC.1
MYNGHKTAADPKLASHRPIEGSGPPSAVTDEPIDLGQAREGRTTDGEVVHEMTGKLAHVHWGQRADFEDRPDSIPETPCALAR